MIKNSVAVVLAFPLLVEACAAGSAQPAGVYQGVLELEQRRLGFEYGGRLEQLWVRRGDSVSAGQRLASMDAGLEELAAEARRGESEAARAELALTRAGARREEIKALEARVRAADAELRQITDNLGRERALLLQGVTPRAVVDELEARFDRATAERDALAHNLSLLRGGPRREEIARAASRAEALLALEEAQSERADRFELAAPVAGEVLDHLYEPGEVVPAGAAVILLADTARPYAEVFVPQRELGGVSVGAPARLWTDASERAFEARIEHLARRTEFTPRYLFSERERSNLVVRVRVRVADPARELHAGVPVRVELVRGAREGSSRGG